MKVYESSEALFFQVAGQVAGLSCYRCSISQYMTLDFYISPLKSTSLKQMFLKALSQKCLTFQCIKINA